MTKLICAIQNLIPKFDQNQKFLFILTSLGTLSPYFFMIFKRKINFSLAFLLLENGQKISGKKCSKSSKYQNFTLIFIVII